MKTESNDTQPKAQNPEPLQTEPASQPDPKPFDPAQDKPAPAQPPRPQLGRFRRLWRIALIWLAVVAVAFLAGMLTFNFIRYKPVNEMLTQTQGELSQANQKVSDLEAQLSAANERATALESDNQAVQSELDAATTQLQLLQVLAEVNNARLALVNGDVPAAKAALENTSAKLEALAPRIAKVDTNLAQSMPQRLTLILAGLDSDLDTVKVDLELLAGNLLDAEAAMFGE
jgi:hypothetical protein